MPDNTDYLQGIIERLTFHSEETGYTVARLKVPKAQDLITVVGNFANIQAGQTLALEGTWRSPKYYHFPMRRSYSACVPIQNQEIPFSTSIPTARYSLLILTDQYFPTLFKCKDGCDGLVFSNS
nr:hypothetical protein [Pseudanabaena cinerea]